MATGSGKTFTAVTESYRLLEHAKAKRVLFLVDRTNLWRQVLEVGPAEIGQTQAERVVSSFEEYIEEHRDEVTALQVFYNQPYGKRHLTLEQIQSWPMPSKSRRST